MEVQIIQHALSSVLHMKIAGIQIAVPKNFRHSIYIRTVSSYVAIL